MRSPSLLLLLLGPGCAAEIDCAAPTDLPEGDAALSVFDSSSGLAVECWCVEGATAVCVTWAAQADGDRRCGTSASDDDVALDGTEIVVSTELLTTTLAEADADVLRGSCEAAD